MFLHNQSGNVGIGSKFGKDLPPAERLDVDGNANLKGTLFFEHRDSGNAVVVPDSEVQSLVVRASGGATFFTLDSSEQHVNVHSPLRFFGGSSSKILLPSDTANALAIDTYSGSPLATVQTSDGNEKLQLHMNLAFTSGDSFYGVDHAIEIESQEAVALKVGTSQEDYLHFDTTSGDDSEGPSVVVDQNLRVVSGHSLRVEDNQASQSTSTGAFSTAGGIGVQRNAYIGGVVTITDNTPSFSTTTGSIVTSGGLGVAKDTHIGGDLDVAGDAVVSKDLSVMYGLVVTQETTIGAKLEVQDTTKAGLSDGTAAAAVIKGGMKVSEDSIFEKDVQIDGELNIAGTFGRSLIVNDTTNAINYETGSLVTEGGLGVELDAFVGGKLTVNGDLDADPTNVTLGAIVTDGGLATAKRLVVGTKATVKDTLDVESDLEASFYSLASVTLRGGLGVEKNIITGGEVEIQSSTSSSGSGSGALKIAGGIGVGMNANVGGNLVVEDTTQATSMTSASLATSGGLYVAKDILVAGGLDVTGSASFSSAASALYGLTVQHGATISGASTFSDTSDSTSSNTGALTVSGGLGVAKSVNIGEKLSVMDDAVATSTTSASATFIGGVGISENVIVGDTIEVQSNTGSSNSSTGALIVSGGLGVGLDGSFGGKVRVEDDADSTSPTTGAVTVSGGLGVSKNVYIGDKLSVNDSSVATSATSASVTFSGGLGVSENIITAGDVEVQGTTNSTSSSTGALVVAGGLGVGSDVNFGGKVAVEDTTASTSSATGAVTVSGGLGVSKNLYVGEMLIVEDDTEASNSTSASFTTNGGIYAAKDVIVSGDLITSEITSSFESGLEITSNGILNVTSASGSDITIESGGNMTLQSDKLTVETQNPSSTSTPHISLLDGYMNIMKKQVSVTNSYSTFATIELSYLKSCHVKVVLEGNWANNPALGTFEFLVMHNGGSDPEPGATNTSDSSQTLTGLVLEEQFVVDTSGTNYYTGVVTAENTANTGSAKEFYVKFKAEGSSVTSSSSFTTNAIITVSGAHTSVE